MTERWLDLDDLIIPQLAVITVTIASYSYKGEALL